MKIIVFAVMVTVLNRVASENSNQAVLIRNEISKCELIEMRLNELEDKFSEKFNGLMALLNGNQSVTQGQTIETTNITVIDTTLSERMEKLEKLANSTYENQNTINKKIADISLIANRNRLLIAKPSIERIISCNEVTTSGVYQLIDPYTIVYCDMNSFDGGWLVIQQRVDFELSFFRDWVEYRDGFGSIGKNTDFWLGLEAVHQITKGGEYELAVQMENGLWEYGYAIYSHFYVSGEHDMYRLTVRGYSGTVGDYLSMHNNMKFSTYDRDNDVHCGKSYSSGWWFSDCFYVNLNNIPSGKMRWGDFANHARYTKMMIRRK